MEQLAGLSLPNPLPVQDDDAREQRNWIIRLKTDLSEVAADDKSALLSKEAIAAVRKARLARGIPTAEVDALAPSVRVLRIDARHVIVNIVTVRLAHDQAHEFLVAASAALVVLDREVPVEEIQGIPRRFWSLLIGPLPHPGPL